MVTGEKSPKEFILVAIPPLIWYDRRVLPAYFAAKGQQAERELVVIDRTEVLFDRLAPRMDEGGYEVVSEPWTSDPVAQLAQRATDGEIGARRLDSSAITSACAPPSPAVMIGPTRSSSDEWIRRSRPLPVMRSKASR